MNVPPLLYPPDPPDRRKPWRLAMWTALALLAVGASVLAAIAIPSYLHDQQSYRDGALAVASAELGRLPPVGGATEQTRDVTNRWGKLPVIIVDYPQTVACDEVQAHYAAAAADAGWALFERGVEGKYYTIVRFRKIAQGYPLLLDINCTDKPPNNDQYEVGLWVAQPGDLPRLSRPDGG
jgi:hypothetical protein